MIAGPVVARRGARGGRLLEPAARRPALDRGDGHHRRRGRRGAEPGGARLRRERRSTSPRGCARSTSSSTPRSAAGPQRPRGRARRRSGGGGERRGGASRSARSRGSRARWPRRSATRARPPSSSGSPTAAEGRIGVDAALPALRPLGLRRRPGDRDRTTRHGLRARPRPTGSARSTGAVAAVTGAARGIGEAIAEHAGPRRGRGHRHRRPSAGRGPDRGREPHRRHGAAARHHRRRRPARLADHVADRHGKLDVLVHNAGITRDKTLGRMEPEQWDAVLEVNLASQLRLNDAAARARAAAAPAAAIISVSSVSGIAGNRGQTNYATTQGGRDRDGRCPRSASSPSRGVDRERGRARVHRDRR